MNADSVFSLCNMLAMIGWIILTLAPFVKIASTIIQKGLVPVLLSIAYIYFIATGFGQGEGSFGSLQGVMQLFTDETLVLAGWIHYLAFDLWLGCWEWGDSRKHGIPYLLLLPCFFLTFMFGPAGLITYLLIRWIYTKKFWAHDNFDFHTES